MTTNDASIPLFVTSQVSGISLRDGQAKGKNTIQPAEQNAGWNPDTGMEVDKEEEAVQQVLPPNSSKTKQKSGKKGSKSEKMDGERWKEGTAEDPMDIDVDPGTVHDAKAHKMDKKGEKCGNFTKKKKGKNTKDTEVGESIHSDTVLPSVSDTACVPPSPTTFLAAGKPANNQKSCKDTREKKAEKHGTPTAGNKMGIDEDTHAVHQ